MSTIKAKNIKQTVVGTTVQPLKIGGILDDGSDAKLTIGTDGNVSLNNLSNTLNLTSGQIKFPATQNPSADANTLDDYEEGTWTPTLVASSVAGNHTYSAQYGSYIKIGKMVYIKAMIEPSALDSSWSGSVSIIGLPFLAHNYVAYSAINLWHSNGITYPSLRTYLDALVVPNTPVLTLYAHGSNIAHTALQNTNFTGVGEITIGGCYIANN